MQSGATRCNGNGVGGLNPQHVPRRCGELAEHKGGGVGCRGFEMLPCRGERPLQWCRQRQAADPGLDRKSTRLNSSHGYISYAVFCLKKKKKYSMYGDTLQPSS